MKTEVFKKRAKSKHVIKDLQDNMLYFEDTPRTVFYSKWLKRVYRPSRKVRLT